MKAIEEAKEFSDRNIETMRAALSTINLGAHCAVILGGSFARREASRESDLDFYIIANSDGWSAAGEQIEEVRRVLTHSVKAPTKDGLFGTVHRIDHMLKEIGGSNDDNLKFTIRTLFLTEGEWLWGKELFEKAREDLVKRYIQPYLKQQHIARFFLNDLARCYRTICVDFENKTFEQQKPWGTRNIKLRFSRKLLYFSGAIVAAEVAGLANQEKIRKMLELLALPPLERLQRICGSKADEAVKIYDFFLEQLGQRTVREQLERIEPDDESRDTNEAFRDLKDKGNEFSHALIRLLLAQYDRDHLIHEAMLL
jgi:predicted nucleotidyltransferase